MEVREVRWAELGRCLLVGPVGHRELNLWDLWSGALPNRMNYKWWSRVELVEWSW